MKRIAELRAEIYDYFQASASCQKFFLDSSHDDKYAAYYNSMFLLQDTTESLMLHRENGFSSNPLTAYLEFWGVMQAAIVQQDAIVEIYEVIVGSALNDKAIDLRAWRDLRELRNLCAGHPAKKNRPRTQPLVRTFMGRMFGDYNGITYERWQQGVVSHPLVPFGTLLGNYASEAGTQLETVLVAMKERWP